VDLPRGQRAIGLKWVFKLKHDEHRNIVKHKARLVAKEHVQCQGIDYEEVFALVARMESVHVLLAVAVHRQWAVHHMVVKSAFLNGKLVKVVYVQQLPSVITTGHEGNVLKLHKALYRLHQAQEPRTPSSMQAYTRSGSPRASANMGCTRAARSRHV